MLQENYFKFSCSVNKKIISQNRLIINFFKLFNLVKKTVITDTTKTVYFSGNNWNMVDTEIED